MPRHTGYASLPLHSGRARAWLFGRMVRLSHEIVVYLTAEYGAGDVLRRLSDPFWFQAFGCVLGFDWHSSGVTTTVCGALKEAAKRYGSDMGIIICGGKGGTSRKTPQDICRACDQNGTDAAPLLYASRLAAQGRGQAPFGQFAVARPAHDYHQGHQAGRAQEGAVTDVRAPGAGLRATARRPRHRADGFAQFEPDRRGDLSGARQPPRSRRLQ